MKSYKIKPEKLVEREVLSWAFTKGWSINVFDSKSIQTNGKLRSNPGLIIGCPDLVGNCSLGFAVYIELKKHKADGVCRLSQRNFLSRKIESNSFACVVDSAEKLDKLYHHWITLRTTSLSDARTFLIKALPTKVVIDGKIISLLL